MFSSSSLPYPLIRSKRKTLAIHVSATGQVTLRAPFRLSLKEIAQFVEKRQSWIQRTQEKLVQHAKKNPPKELTKEALHEMKQQLKSYLEGRVRFWWEQANVPAYTSIKITKSEKRWGSCSVKNGLCFSYRLAYYLPKEPQGTSLFLDAIIVHEIAHLQEKNHQKPFWNLVYRILPQYTEAFS